MKHHSSRKKKWKQYKLPPLSEKQLAAIERFNLQWTETAKCQAMTNALNQIRRRCKTETSYLVSIEDEYYQKIESITGWDT